MSHRDRVVRLPDGFKTLGSTDHCPHAAVACEAGGRRLYGFQFHPEVTHSQKGEKMLGAFVDLAGLRGSWRMDDFVAQQIASIKEKCSGGRNVFVLVSGGVDSTVTYVRRADYFSDEIRGWDADVSPMNRGDAAAGTRTFLR